jgi:hypothetical protein
MTEQLDFPFFLDEEQLIAFLTQWCALEDEEDRLREAKRILKEMHQDHFPMRATLVAIKRVRAQRKLEQHPKEPMSRTHQGYLEARVEKYFMLEDLARELADSGVTITAPVPDMTEKDK